MPQVSRDTCSGTASIWPLRGYTRNWDGKRGDDAAFRSDISAWMCHNRLANLVAYADDDGETASAKDKETMLLGLKDLIKFCRMKHKLDRMQFILCNLHRIA